MKRSCQSAWRLLHHLALSGQEDEGLVGSSCGCHAEHVDVGGSSRSRSCNMYIFFCEKKRCEASQGSNIIGSYSLA